MEKCAQKTLLEAELKTAMRARDKERTNTLRLIMSEIKRIEVDERIAVDDSRVLSILDKMLKQRRDSIQQFKDAQRNDLAEQEEKEVAIIQQFLPEQLSESEITEIIDAAITQTNASSMADMGKVMGQIKPQLQGRADMGEASAILKARLSA